MTHENARKAFPLLGWSTLLSLNPLLIFALLEFIIYRRTIWVPFAVGAMVVGWLSAKLGLYAFTIQTGRQGIVEIGLRHMLFWFEPVGIKRGDGWMVMEGEALQSRQWRPRYEASSAAQANLIYHVITGRIKWDGLPADWGGLFVGYGSQLAFGRVSELYGGWQEQGGVLGGWSGPQVFFMKRCMGGPFPNGGPLPAQCKAYAGIGLGIRIFIGDWPDQIAASRNQSEEAMAAWKLAHELGHVSLNGLKASSATFFHGCQSVASFVGLIVLQPSIHAVLLGSLALAAVVPSILMRTFLSEVAADAFASAHLPASKVERARALLRRFLPMQSSRATSAARLIARMRMLCLDGTWLGQTLVLACRHEHEIAAIVVGVFWFLSIGDTPLAHPWLAGVFFVTAAFLLYVGCNAIFIRFFFKENMASAFGNFQHGLAMLQHAAGSDDILGLPKFPERAWYPFQE
jgi:hypothetical protein